MIKFLLINSSMCISLACWNEVQQNTLKCENNWKDKLESQQTQMNQKTNNLLMPIISCFLCKTHANWLEDIPKYYLLNLLHQNTAKAHATTHPPVCANRAYPENANFKTCVPSSLKFYTFCGLHQAKKYWNF